MATLSPDALGDLVELTYNRQVEKNNWIDISLTKQFFCTADRFLRGKQMPMKGGPKVIWKAQVRNTNAAKWTGLFSKDSYDVQNLTIGAEQAWSIATTNYSFDVNEPEFQTTDYTLIVEEILVREHAMLNNWFELLEAAFWTAPASDTQDPRPLFGIPFWIQKNATEGFNGGNPAGFSSGAGGINATTYPNWKNYTFPYTTITRDDIIAKWLKAVEFCHFRAPHDFNRLDGSGEPDWMFYTTYAVLEPLQKFLDARNDNLTDLAGMAGRATFMSIPVKWVPELTNSDADGYDTSNPVYGVNWQGMKFYFLRGREMVRTPPRPKDGMHNVRVVHTDATCSLLCLNRREQFVGYVS